MKANSGKAKKPTGHEQVMAYLDKLEPDLKRLLSEVRKIILSANDSLTEHIKWNAPSFCLHGEDRITYNLHRKEGFMIVFHCGAKPKEPPAQGRLFEDTTGLLKWAADDRATLALKDMEDVEQYREQLKELVVKWLEVASPQ